MKPHSSGVLRIYVWVVLEFVTYCAVRKAAAGNRSNSSPEYPPGLMRTHSVSKQSQSVKFADHWIPNDSKGSTLYVMK